MLSTAQGQTVRTGCQDIRVAGRARVICEKQEEEAEAEKKEAKKDETKK